MLVFLESEKYLARFFQNPYIVGVVTTPVISSALPERYGVAVSDHPRKAFFTFHNYLATKTDFYWKDFPSQISENAIIHPNAYVAPRNVRIGRGTVIEPGVTVLERSIIGEDVILRAGCTVGSQGFYLGRIEGEVFSIAHAGGVKIHDRVEVQANSAISRSVFHEYTELGEDTKLDNLVHIAHNSKIGARCLLAANAMVAGSVTIGDDVWIGPGASISNEITIGDGARITIGSVVTRDVAPGQSVSGNFAIEHDKFIAFLKTIR
jgi:UDP-3-O-[3-hydroxymyristoyl] glucosamine N-acyltransferase